MPAESRIVEHAGELILVVAPVVGLVWGAGQALLGWVSGIGPRTRRLVPRVEGAVGVVLVALAGALALVSTHDPVGKVEHEYDQFVNLRVSQTEDSRLFSGGGYRHEYWRVAWNAFRDRPLRGLGAGNYDLAYLRERRIGESIRQPHSLELQTLAELGVVGGAAVIAFVIAVLAGLGRAARSAREDRLIRLVAVGAGGAFIAWLGHTSVEWLHYIPGVTGVALCGAAMLLAPWMKPVRKRLRHPTRAAMTVAAAVAVLVVGAVLGRTAAAEHMRLEGREELRSDAIQALRLADQSLALNDNALPSLYLKSAAYARLNRYREARAALLDATRLEPHDPVPWGLLGDLAVRRGDLSHARRSYRRASQLSPRDAILKKLASDPRVARQRLEEPRGGG